MRSIVDGMLEGGTLAVAGDTPSIADGTLAVSPLHPSPMANGPPPRAGEDLRWSSRGEPVDHGFGYQHDAVVGAAEALGVGFRVLAYDQTVGDFDAAIYHHL